MYFLNDKLLSDEQNCIEPYNRGLLLADGLFETLLATNGTVHALPAHIERLASSAAILGIPWKYTEATVRQICQNLLIKNNLTETTAAIRITLTRGSSDRGIDIPQTCHPTLLITAREYQQIVDKPKLIVIPDYRRNEHSPTSRMKTLQYLDNMMCRKLAKEAGADDALMMNTAGHVVCATTANLFIKTKAGVLITPPISDGVLPGIMRASVLAEARSNQTPLLEQSITLEMLKEAKQVMICNSLIGMKHCSL